MNRAEALRASVLLIGALMVACGWGDTGQDPCDDWDETTSNTHQIDADRLARLDGGDGVMDHKDCEPACEEVDPGEADNHAGFSGCSVSGPDGEIWTLTCTYDVACPD